MSTTQGAELVALIRSVGGIVHSDGNIFFKNAEQFQRAAALRSPGQQAGEPSEEAIREALESQPWTPEHCKTYPRRAAEEIAFLRAAIANAKGQM